MRNLITLLLILILSACTGHHRQNKTLTEINALCDSNPGLAMSKLAAINSDTLSDFDRHHFDLLRIKSLDKAYMEHTSDSLILDVVEYFESIPGSPLYPEALYYAGRVYADMGDYSSSINYFQQTLDNIPEDRDHILFRSIVLSQTGRLLNELRLYDRAIPYIEKSIDLSEDLPNTNYGNTYNHHLLYLAYLSQGNNQKAEEHIRKALDMSKALTPDVYTDMRIDMAHLMFLEGKLDSALLIIRPLMECVDSISHLYALARASEIYSHADIPDTAYMYAQQLISSTDISSRKSGFEILFSEEMHNFVSHDTLLHYIGEYRDVLEEYTSRHNDEEAMISDAKYNYDRHLKKRIKTERRLRIISTAFTVSLIIILTLLLYMLYKKAGKAKLRLDVLTHALMHTWNKDKANCLQEGSQLNNITDICQYNTDNPLQIIAEREIKQSQVYLTLISKIDNKCIITDNETLFDDLTALIESVYPGFSDRVNTIADKKISPSEFKVILLIKCGFKPSKIACLLGRERNTISTQRNSIAKKLLGDQSDISTLDRLILSL